MERLQHEFAAIGFYLSAHPLDSFGASLKRLDVVSFADLPRWLKAKGATRARVAGLVVGKQERTSQKGNRFAFIQLTDASGMYEATIFSERLTAAREMLEPGRALLLNVDCRQDEEGGLRLMVNEVSSLDQAAAATAAGLRIFLKDAGPVESIRQILGKAGRGKGKIELVLDIPEQKREVDITLRDRIAVSPAVRGAIRAIQGVAEVMDT
jgi:DNA polymerase-3 subunit alpha